MPWKALTRSTQPLSTISRFPSLCPFPSVHNPSQLTAPSYSHFFPAASPPFTPPSCLLFIGSLAFAHPVHSKRETCVQLLFQMVSKNRAMLDSIVAAEAMHTKLITGLAGLLDDQQKRPRTLTFELIKVFLSHPSSEELVGHILQRLPFERVEEVLALAAS